MQIRLKGERRDGGVVVVVMAVVAVVAVAAWSGWWGYGTNVGTP